MFHISSLSIVLAMLTSCATTPGSRPHDMSTAGHEHSAAAEDQRAATHAAEYDPNATVTAENCAAGLGTTTRVGADLGIPCWTSVTNPTEVHQREAAEHRRHAADHRAASVALQNAEAAACGGISPDDRDTSPFDHREDIVSVEPIVERTGTPNAPMPRTVGALVTFRAVPGMTAEWLQRLIDCHLARNASLGHMMPEMANCPLVPNGVEARVSATPNGFAVALRSNDSETARDIVARAERAAARR